MCLLCLLCLSYDGVHFPRKGATKKPLALHCAAVVAPMLSSAFLHVPACSCAFLLARQSQPATQAFTQMNECGVVVGEVAGEVAGAVLAGAAPPEVSPCTLGVLKRK